MNELGVETLDADDVVHELLPDPEERRRIAAEVFSDPEKRRALEAKIHPIVKARIDQWLDGTNVTGGTTGTDRTNGTIACLDSPGGLGGPVRVAVIPLLLEAHWEKNFDIICCVVSSREKQIERMMTTRGMTRAEAEARLAAQMPVEEKAKRSHYVIHNDGTAEELKVQAAAFLKFVMQKQMQPKLPND
ncbi:MAG: dephospho-CoA kinase [Kiritimatiellae bacterium]|nr:dephospho-CoA kinase [Kiritimatiellia bacterium]